MNRQRLFCLLLLFTVNGLHAQPWDQRYFDHYTTADGLLHNEVRSMAQDSTGYVWITTAYGLNRFNGRRFVPFHSNSNPASLPSEDLFGTTWLDKSRLAVFSAGLHIIDTRTGGTRNLFIPYHDRQFQYKFNMIERAMGDEKGNLYLLTRSGFYHYDNNYNLVSRFDYYSEAEVPVTHFHFGSGLFELDKERLLIVSINGLYQYHKKEKKVRKLTAADCPLLAGYLGYPSAYYLFFQHKPGRFFILKPESDSLVYLNTIENKKTVSRLAFNPGPTTFGWRSRMVAVNDTLFYITGHGSGFYKMRFYPGPGTLRLYPEKYFGAYLCNALLKDKDNNLWIATNKGLFRENPQKTVVQVADLPPAVEDSFPNTRLDDVHVSENRIYAAARSVNGLFLFDKKTFLFQKQLRLHQPGVRLSPVMAMAAVDAATLLLGTNGPLKLLNLQSGREKLMLPPKWNRKGDWTGDLCKDRKGNIWIGSGYIYTYHPSTQQFTVIPTLEQLLNPPSALAEDTAGNIWMAGHGMARYNTTLHQYDLVLDSFPFIKMPDKQINSLVIDSRNEVWFNSNNNGLISYDVAAKTFRHFTRTNGLPDDNIATLMVVGNRLWIACYSGIACLDLRTGQIQSFGIADGFPDMPILKGARFFYDKELKQLYIGFSTAVVRFNPDEVLRKKTPPQAFIESVIINGNRKAFLPGQHLTTSLADNEINITMGTINFRDGATQHFAYRVGEKNNTPWVYTGPQAMFSISGLAPGTHRIQVKTYSPDNRWPEQIRELTLTVLPPVWRATWFLIAAGAIILALLYLFIKWRIALARKKERVKTEIQKLKADDYKNQFELEQISNYFSSSLAAKKTEGEVLWDVSRNLIGRMGYEDCIIYMWNDNKTKMVQKAAYGPKGAPEVIFANVFEVEPGQGIVGHVIQTQQPVLVNDTRTDTRYRVDDDFRLSEVAVPIVHDDELLGVIDSENSRPGYFSERDIKILTTIATLIGNKLKQLESEQSLEAKQHELAGINEQLAEARLSALQTQMNPHFVFNALNSIKRMILDGDNEKASRYLSKFALMIRMTLNHSKEVFVTLDENIAYIKAYLEMEQLRFDESFSYSIYTGENIDVSEIAIPSMMIQPLVENAIWHGLMQVETDKKIRIRFTEKNNKIICIVEDNGIGIRQSEKLKSTAGPAHLSIGLENLQKRIRIMNEKYNTACSLHITDLKEISDHRHGTRVVLQLNLINT